MNKLGVVIPFMDMDQQFNNDCLSVWILNSVYYSFSTISSEEMLLQHLKRNTNFHQTTRPTPKINTALLTNNWNNLITKSRHPTLRFDGKRRAGGVSNMNVFSLWRAEGKTVVLCSWMQRTLLIWWMPQVNSLIKNVCSAAQRTH